MRTLLLLAPERTTAGLSARLDLTMLTFTVLVAVGASLLFGLAPAWHASGRPPVDALKAGGRGAGGSVRQGLRSLLVVSETALALVLLVGAGLFLRSLANMQEIHPGFDAQGVMTAAFVASRLQGPAQPRRVLPLSPPAARRDAWHHGRRRPAPFSGNRPRRSASGDQSGPVSRPHGDVKCITPGYFSAEDPLAGRLFTDQDRGARCPRWSWTKTSRDDAARETVGKRLAGARPPPVDGRRRRGPRQQGSLAADVGKGATYCMFSS
jgi:hypothetical protein